MIIASRKGTPRKALNFITNSTRKQPIISISYQHKPNPQHQIQLFPIINHQETEYLSKQKDPYPRKDYKQGTQKNKLKRKPKETKKRSLPESWI